MSSLTEAAVTITLAIVGVAMLAVLVSRNANTAGVLTAYGNTFSAMIGAATRPVSGGGLGNPVLGMPLATQFPM